MRKTFFKMGVLLSLAFSMASCQIGQASVQEPEKEVIEVNAIYPDFDLHEICQEATTIVHGIVREKGETFLYNVSLDDDPSYRAYTPYTVAVISYYKGNTGENEITYIRSGGETDTAIYSSVEPDFELGSEVILFLNENGGSWPTQGTYLVTDGKIEIFSDMLPETFSSDDSSGLIEMDVSDFSSLISDALNNG